MKYGLSNTEAINAIRKNYPPENYSILREALDLAIEALEKQKTFDNGTWVDKDYHDKVYALLQERYFKALERTRWIPVSERLPEKDKSVFVFTDCGETDFAYIGHTTGHWFTNGMLLIPNVTHWMSLPEPPEQEV